MQTIYKYALEVTDKQRVNLPKGAEILTVQEQYGVPCIWAQVDTTSPPEERIFETFGTGHEMPIDMGIDRKYIGTYQIQGGSLVFHLFERL